MTLPNLPNYSPRPSSHRRPDPVPSGSLLDLVHSHPLSPMIRRAMMALSSPSGTVFGSGFVFPTKRELAKLIAQAQAPAFAKVTPTLLVLLTLHFKLLRYVRDLSHRIGEALARGCSAPTSSSSTCSSSSPISIKSCDSDDDDRKVKRARLARQSNEFMTAWFLAHKANPYPTAKERAEIASMTHLSDTQVKNWFANMRKRHWKPPQPEKLPRCLMDVMLRRDPTNQG
ncbi:hypothetical protein H257_06327 [Aphanomyces astaci]|uniref:Homeobox domain-containing protein n=2 Tax=Aphanomyces astaci TaxID=112090 RepID=W4GND3_APHAT|nr:hypothetical protein H257_06327 [Aphanomyces astaci]ETV80871.1 hypothetical protein H257_06327 [Aphanomyces astaci]RQM27728.1 hypothetical protein B5M09_001321 [Aphanomyces astaci]|eukprot:XP_009829818.1 hypothetical protein H257_06327 [Aphanomyces astaci]